MKVPRAINKLSPDVARKCKDEGMKISIDDVMFILSRFVHYSRLAIINGYSVSSKNFKKYIKIRLCRQIFGKLTRQEKEKYFISPKLLSFMFYVNIQVGCNCVHNTNFTPCDEFKDMINESLSTDLAYKFIGR